MRSLWVSLILLISITAIAILDSYIMIQKIDDMSVFLEEFKKDGMVDASKLENAEAIFEKNKWLFCVSVSMDAVDQTEHAFLLLRRAAENQSAAEASAALVGFEYALNRLREAATPSLATVF